MLVLAGQRGWSGGLRTEASITLVSLPLCKNVNEFPEKTKNSQNIITEGVGVITVLLRIVPLCIVSLLVPVNTSVIIPACLWLVVRGVGTGTSLGGGRRTQQEHRNTLFCCSTISFPHQTFLELPCRHRCIQQNLDQEGAKGYAKGGGYRDRLVSWGLRDARDGSDKRAGIVVT